MQTKCSALRELIDFSRELGYQDWDTSGQGLRSWTFGKQDVFCLTVRFDKFWRVVHAIYVKFPEQRNIAEQELYVYNREKHKRDKLYWILKFLPEDFVVWDELFGVS